ncbi:hypothetical protein GIB67_043044 [Kingdonia uniflora]|uniref:Uncharacterized protein n=1 Tax=Kingdonia uniflora TaxID=39325 RepID=A0A7J7NTQ0_9MAGN|nr:hypothetical protein GIB67_043044 [Kingdonia uniflora]
MLSTMPTRIEPKLKNTRILPTRRCSKTTQMPYQSPNATKTNQNNSEQTIHQILIKCQLTTEC